jgi:glutamine synthetase
MDAIKNVFKLIEDNDIEFVDFRFCDFNGKWRHITFSVTELNEKVFQQGLAFDGSSIEGWCPINKSDMFYVPDAASAFIDPFMAHPTLVLLCDVTDPTNGKTYNRDPRGVAKRAEQFAKQSGFADQAFFGPELEFFLFDDVIYSATPNESFYKIDASTGAWNRGKKLEEGSHGHIAGMKGNYFSLAPVDRNHDVRSEMCSVLRKIGIDMHLHHGEVATAGQSELGMRFNTLTRKADEVLMYKYVVHNVADQYGKTATFMPKPLAGDNGSGMHVHQSLWKGGKNLFAGNRYDGLSDTALHYIGGIIKHAKAINAFTNPTTNSYKRLIPGYEAPVILAYAARNRSASIRIPASGTTAAAKRIEVRFPDPTANPYLGMAAMLMAGLDGVKNKIDPGEALEDNLYARVGDDLNSLPQVCGSLDEALRALDADRAFLTEGGVFDDDMIDAYIELKSEDVVRLNHTPAPVEFEMYFSA